jgi:hypothetical protein
MLDDLFEKIDKNMMHLKLNILIVKYQNDNKSFYMTVGKNTKL